MRKSLIDLVVRDQETLNYELPDAALEVAASKGSDLSGNSFTLAFCTGLDSCGPPRPE
jgi:hypothetical protein